jgi:hypothetical protein
MAVFDQRDQHVMYQYNAAGNINFGAVQNRVDLVDELEKLQTELTAARRAGIFSEEIATDATFQLTKAVQQAQQPAPDKKTLLNHLNSAKTLIEGVTAASGLVTALVKAAELVQKLL